MKIIVGTLIAFLLGSIVASNDAEARCCFFVDVVGADAGPNNCFKPMIAGEGFSRNLYTAAADGAFELGQRFAQPVAFETGANLVLDTLCASVF